MKKILSKMCLTGLGLSMLALLTGCGNTTSNGIQQTQFHNEPKAIVQANNVKSELSSSVVHGGNKLMAHKYFNIDFKWGILNENNKLDAFHNNKYLIQSDVADMNNHYSSLDDFRSYDGAGPTGSVHTIMTKHTLTFWHAKSRLYMPLHYVKYKLIGIQTDHHGYKRFIFRPVSVQWTGDTKRHLSNRENRAYHLTLTRVHRFVSEPIHEHDNGELPK